MKIQFATTDEQLLKCRKTILELRPHISETEYLEKAKLLLSEGAKMIYVDEGTDAPAVSVFRINYYFYRGENVYMDDLVRITEFVAENATGITDEDGDYSDWIEFHSPTTARCGPLRSGVL